MVAEHPVCLACAAVLINQRRVRSSGPDMMSRKDRHCADGAWYRQAIPLFRRSRHGCLHPRGIAEHTRYRNKHGTKAPTYVAGPIPVDSFRSIQTHRLLTTSDRLLIHESPCSPSDLELRSRRALPDARLNRSQTLVHSGIPHRHLRFSHPGNTCGVAGHTGRDSFQPLRAGRTSDPSLQRGYSSAHPHG